MSLLALAAIAGLAAVERKGFLQAMLSRPIALGPITGAALGDAQIGLLVGVPLELLWLGAVNMGAALPVHEALGTTAIAGAAALGLQALRADGVGGAALAPAAATLAFVLCAPLALAGRRAERLVERWNERLYARAERALADGRLGEVTHVNLRGLAMPFGISFVLAPLGAAAGGAIVHALLRRWPGAHPALGVGWAALGGLACASGAKAMRAQGAPVWFFASLAVGLALLAATAFAGGRT